MEDFKLTHELISESIKSLSSTLNILAKIKQQQKEKKDYEILTYQHIVLSNELDKNIIIDKTSKHFEYAHGCQNDFKIHSVRRLSDGEVFTLGDDFCLSPCTRTYTISSFRIDGNLLYINSNNDYPVTIPHLIKKHKEPLFTTEDGVRIYVGDTYYTLEPDNNWFFYYSGAAGYGSGKRTIAKYFSTKEAAEDWILYHKPMLSVKDVYKVIQSGLDKRRRESNFKI